MRTTVDLPDSVLKDVKIAAIQNNMTLREFILETITRRIYSTQAINEPDELRPLPLVGTEEGALSISLEDIKALELEDDLRRALL